MAPVGAAISNKRDAYQEVQAIWTSHRTLEKKIDVLSHGLQSILTILRNRLPGEGKRRNPQPHSHHHRASQPLNHSPTHHHNPCPAQRSHTHTQHHPHIQRHPRNHSQPRSGMGRLHFSSSLTPARPPHHYRASTSCDLINSDLEVCPRYFADLFSRTMDSKIEQRELVNQRVEFQQHHPSFRVNHRKLAMCYLPEKSKQNQHQQTIPISNPKSPLKVVTVDQQNIRNFIQYPVINNDESDPNMTAEKGNDSYEHTDFVVNDDIKLVEDRFIVIGENHGLDDVSDKGIDPTKNPDFIVDNEIELAKSAIVECIEGPVPCECDTSIESGAKFHLVDNWEKDIEHGVNEDSIEDGENGIIVGKNIGASVKDEDDRRWLNKRKKYAVVFMDQVENDNEQSTVGKNIGALWIIGYYEYGDIVEVLERNVYFSENKFHGVGLVKMSISVNFAFSIMGTPSYLCLDFVFGIIFDVILGAKYGFDITNWHISPDISFHFLDITRIYLVQKLHSAGFLDGIIIVLGAAFQTFPLILILRLGCKASNVTNSNAHYETTIGMHFWLKQLVIGDFGAVLDSNNKLVNEFVEEFKKKRSKEGCK